MPCRRHARPASPGRAISFLNGRRWHAVLTVRTYATRRDYEPRLTAQISRTPPANLAAHSTTTEPVHQVGASPAVGDSHFAMIIIPGQSGTYRHLQAHVTCRALVLDHGGIEEIWCALSVRATNGSHVRDELRELLFAAVEAHFPEAVFEVRSDWPTGCVGWWEIVRFGLR
jgi:hypothetical protein